MSENVMLARAPGVRPDTSDAEVLSALHLSLAAELEVQQHHVEELSRTAEELAGEHDNDAQRERAFAEGGAERARAVIAQIEAALRRVDEGRYGTCVRCGGEVGLARLEAIPYAPNCVNCPSD